MQETFERSIDSLGEIFDFLDLFFEESGLDAAGRYVIGMAIEEVFTNMVKYNPDGQGTILINVQREASRAIIELTDFDSRRFDPTLRPEVDVGRPIEDRTPGGLGIHLIQKLMDEFDYEFSEGRSTIKMTKNLEGSC